MFNRSLASLLSSMTKMADRLEAHAAHATAKEAAKRQAAADLQDEAARHGKEAAQASRVAARVRNLTA